jgi:hypothetical protein
LDLLTLIHSHSSGPQAIQRYRYSTHFQFTVAHALGFSVFTSRILATDLPLSLQLTYGVFLVQSNYFLAISCSCQFRRLDPTLFRLLFCTPTASELPIPESESESELFYDWLPYIYAARIYIKHVSRVRMRGANHIENTASSILRRHVYRAAA